MAENLKEYGYEYIVVDIQWASPTAKNHEYEPFAALCMDAYGRLLPAENRFPSAEDGKGFKPLADYVHGLGLKFGIHIMRGLPRAAAHDDLPIWDSAFMCRQAANPLSICAWNPDMYSLFADRQAARDYYDSIFKLYAEWGVDFVKVDDIARLYPESQTEIEIISKACRGCGRDMVLSLSPGPAPLERAEHLKEYANMWRITDDFWDEWKLLYAMFERAEKWCIHSGAGHWPDADMLPVGAIKQDYDVNHRTRFNEDEQITMLTLWCMMRSPLMIGGEMTKFDAFTKRLLTNAEVLEILKTTYCAHPLYTKEHEIVWIAPRSDCADCYVAIFNISDEPRKAHFSPEALGIDNVKKIKELWGYGEEEMNPHGARLYRLYK